MARTESGARSERRALIGRMARAALTKGAGAIGAAVIAVLLMLAGTASAATPSPADQNCLICHGTPGLEKPLTDGETLSLHIEGDHFADSVHAPLGCTGCHSGVNLASHPPANNPIVDRRAFSIAMVQVCQTCHADKFEQWGKSVHAALVKDGNPNAPICTNCHSPHTMIKGAAASVATVPCKTCHSVIFTAYTTSVHGVLRNGGLAAAPLCFDCHGAHDVAVPSAGVGRRDVCLGCHTEAMASHLTWLPNVQLHFDVVSCPVCHTPNAQRVVNLILYNNSTQKEVSQPEGIPRFELKNGTPTGLPGLDPTTLMTLLTALNGQGIKGETNVRGRLDVRTGVEDHQLTFATKAISDCDTCHRQGATAFQSVEVSVAGPAGIPIHYGADKDVLSSVFSIDSVGGFYAIGGSRVTFFDVLLFLALLGGFAWPIAHLIVRWVVGRYLDLTIPHEPR